MLALTFLLLMGTGPPAGARAPIVVAAGDIACPGHPCPPQRATARLIGVIDPHAVLTLGDNQYERGSLIEYRASYDPTWGRFQRRTHPSPGNHDYGTAGAAGYFRYFGWRAHRRSGGMYSFDIGRWHLVSIDSGRGRIAAWQLRWVRRDLRRDDHRCELAYFHHPRWSSGAVHGSQPAMAALWQVLVGQGVDVALAGHDHGYERFRRLDGVGRPAPESGVREFVVGTGGRSLYPFGPAIRGSRRRLQRYGVLRLVLHPRSYGWRFVSVGRRILDSGNSICHR
jgi:hypothetical protein